MKTRRFPAPGLCSLAVVVAAGCVAMTPVSLYGQKKRANPTSKVYISDVGGDAVIETTDSVEDVSKRSVYAAQGTVIETKRSENPADRNRNFSTMVYSNGTGAFFDADTRVEVKKFVQEPFTPNRADIEVEPSITQTQAFISRGTVGLCTSKQVAGSNMTYQTPHGSVNIRGRKVVIETNRDVTKISMLEGDSTVRAGEMDMGGHTIHAGEQATIRHGGAGEANIIQIAKIPPAESPQLDEKVSMACLAKKTVYFEVKEKGVGALAGEIGDAAAGSDGTTPDASGAVTAFDDPGASTPSARELVPVQVVPTNLPTQYTETPARIETSRPGG